MTVLMKAVWIYSFTSYENYKMGEYLKIKEEINFKILEVLESEGVTIAFPSRRLYLETPLHITSENKENNTAHEEEIKPAGDS